MILLEETKANIEFKYSSAKRATAILQSNKVPLEEAIDAFSSLINSYYAIWSYLKKWVKANYSGIIKPERYLENWQHKYLTDEERGTWNLISSLRNEDAHEAPIAPKYSIYYDLIVMDEEVLIMDGVPVITDAWSELRIVFDGVVYNLLKIVSTLDYCYERFTATFAEVLDVNEN